RERARRHAGGPAAPRGRPAAARGRPASHQRALRVACDEGAAGDHRVGVGGVAGGSPSHRPRTRCHGRVRSRDVRVAVSCDPTFLSMLSNGRGGAPVTGDGTTTWATRATLDGCTT